MNTNDKSLVGYGPFVENNAGERGDFGRRMVHPMQVSTRNPTVMLFRQRLAESGRRPWSVRRNAFLGGSAEKRGNVPRKSMQSFCIQIFERRCS